MAPGGDERLALGDLLEVAAEGFQMSWRTSGASERDTRTIPSAAMYINTRPPRRRASTVTPTTAAQLTKPIVRISAPV